MGNSSSLITLSDAATNELREALKQASPGEVVRFSVGRRFHHGLQLGLAQPGDVIVDAGGLEVHIDADSAKRATGARIDFLPGKEGGFRIENPNEPPRVHVMLPPELKAWIDAGAKLELIDVRPADEREKAAIPGHRAIDESRDYVDALSKDTVLVFYCHRGSRALKAAAQYVELGFLKVYNLAGGIDDWSAMVDDSIPRY
jgi:monothiol glutaredoxin